MSVVVVGINHRSVPLRVLERVAIAESDLPKALHDLHGREHIGEAVIVSTCMRTEVYATVSRFHAAVGAVRDFLADWSGDPPETISDYLYDYYDEGAARHLLRVAAGLDSAVLGEGEILRQVRTAAEVARTERASGPALGLLFRHAVEAGKRVRSETAIARGTTSLSHTAVSLADSVGAPLHAVPPEASACPVFGHTSSATLAGAGSMNGDLNSADLRSADLRSTGPTSTGLDTGALPWTAGEASGDPCSWSSLLTGRRVLVIGAGEMGRAVATLLAGAPGAGPLRIANRTLSRAEDVARPLGAGVVPWEALPAAVGAADIVMVSTTAGRVLLDANTVTEATAARARAGQARPLVIVDLSVPRNVDPVVAALPAVVLFDVTHLKAHAEAAMQGRRREIPAADGIVEEELRRLTKASTQRGATPIIAALQARGEAIRAGELDRLQGRLGQLDPRQQRAVEALTRGIVAKLLHQPTVNLKAALTDGDGDRLLRATEELFDL